MANKARLTKIGLRNFKSFGASYQELDIRPLTVLLGRNNSGKSTIIQALLLLKQTLAYPRPEVPLHLEGYVDAIDLGELTHGWPPGDGVKEGPEITLEWESRLDVSEAVKAIGDRSVDDLARETEIPWLGNGVGHVLLRTRLELQYCADEKGIYIHWLGLDSWRRHASDWEKNPSVQPFVYGMGPRLAREAEAAFMDRSHQRQDWGAFTVKLDHFLPYLRLARGASSIEGDARVRRFRILFEQPIDDLKTLLLRSSYLGSTRLLPSTVYRPSSTPPDDVGVSGEYAAQILHARRAERVHYLPLLRIGEPGGAVDLQHQVRSLPLADAVQDVFSELGIEARLRIEDIQNVGFRLLFGSASLQHVGRGIGYLLPIVEAGLIADPMGRNEDEGDMELAAYLDRCAFFPHLALEEPESHLHPKVQTRLAHLMVSLARCGRQMLVETHSDHLVRRLRGLIARAAPGGEVEQWLHDNVNIVGVEQSPEGVTTLHQSRLTPEGSIAERWPADFMDEASDEERSIYFASLDKREAAGEVPYAAGTEFIEGEDED